jgi:DNA modification methylase
MTTPRVEVLPLFDAVQPDQNNVNRHTQRGAALVNNSIRKRGLFRGIAAAGKGTDKPTVYAGNLTLEQAVEAGITEAIVVHTTGNQMVVTVRDDVEPGSAEAIALGLEDNESGKQSYNPDIDLLAQMAAGENAILSALRKADAPFNSMLEGMGLKDETQDAEPQIGGGEALEKWKVKAGDLFKLGIHKLLCGDSTKREDIERLIEGNKYCVLTDPPYNVEFEYNGMDDKMTPQEYANFCEAWFEAVKDAECMIFSPGPKNIRLYPAPRDMGYWLKRNASAGASAFNLRTIEPLLIYGKIGQKRNFDLFDYSSGFTEELRAARCAARVEDKHPPAKPIGLWLDLLDMLPSGLPVLDCFSGNGTTFIACQNKERICYGNERDPSYCALILERMSTAFPGIEIERI